MTASGQNLKLLEAMLPGPDTDVIRLFRDEDVFAATTEALGGLFHPDLESVPAWRGAGNVYSGVEGFREMWLDWLEPWATYRVQVEEMIEAGDSVVVLVRDRARRPDVEAEVELISGSVWTFRDRKVARVAFYANRDELREATGLRF
jgi:ketosteroid isomerase-like protein